MSPTYWKIEMEIEVWVRTCWRRRDRERARENEWVRVEKCKPRAKEIKGKRWIKEWRPWNIHLWWKLIDCGHTRVCVLHIASVRLTTISFHFVIMIVIVIVTDIVWGIYIHLREIIPQLQQKMESHLPATCVFVCVCRQSTSGERRTKREPKGRERRVRICTLDDRPKLKFNAMTNVKR